MIYDSCGFEQLDYYLPPQLVPIEELIRRAGLKDETITRLYNGGLRKVPVDESDSLIELTNKAVKKLASKVPNFSTRVRGVVFTHSLQLIAPADVPFLDLCVNDTGLNNILKIAVGGQPCAIMHMGLQLASLWLCEIPLDCGIVLIGADKVYSPDERIFFGSAMGDASVAGFITREAKNNRILTSISESKIIAVDGEDSLPEDITEFRQLNPLFIRHAIESCLEQGKIRLEDLHLIIPHTPYVMIWDTVAELLRFPREKILTRYINETGHLNSNDSFIHYIRAVKEGIIKEGDVVLLVNPAFGGTRGCTLIRR